MDAAACATPDRSGVVGNGVAGPAVAGLLIPDAIAFSGTAGLALQCAVATLSALGLATTKAAVLTGSIVLLVGVLFAVAATANGCVATAS